MKEQGIFFSEEQKELLREVDRLENNPPIDEYLKKYSQGMPERVFDVDERKKLTISKRMEICDSIIKDYSMLKKQKGILHEQIFSAMERYLRECNGTGYEIIGLY